MSRKDDSEDDIWEYKSLEKKRKKRESSPTTQKRKCTVKKTSNKKKDASLSVKKTQVKDAGGPWDDATESKIDGVSSLEHQDLPLESSPGTRNTGHAAEASSSGDFCPICQMPFFILVVQSQRWHVSECLDTPRDTCKECPDGLRCSSTIPNHYKKFNHTFLAHSRANGDSALLSASQQAQAGLGHPPGLINREVDSCLSESSQDSALNLSALSSQSLSQNNSLTGTPQSELTNGLQLLRSPGPEDLKKKKGWLSSSQGQKSVLSSQESKKEILFTPVKKDDLMQTGESISKNEFFPEYDDAISFSPLSELPTETEVSNTGCKKALFNTDALENGGENSMILFNDSFSSEDELFTEFIENNLGENDILVKDKLSSSPQLGSFSSLAATNDSKASAVVANRAESPGVKETSSILSEVSQSSFQSPQSVVLDRLRDTILTSNNPSLNHCSFQPEQNSSQTSSFPRSQTMPPQKGSSKTGQASGLKQTDIGVFFGLRPLKKEVVEEPNEGNTSSVPAFGENSRQRRPRKERQRKPRSGTTAATSQGSETVENDALNGQQETGRGGTRGWRRSTWNRSNGDGEVQSRNCPFYKKIPGTTFTVDAFRYGVVEGITAYFLTHFHSDHYGGLTKKSTFPIYCNTITGNLVKSKLRVAEEHVHILPMNTEVTVDGVRVIFLDANHCPGAAMLLFFLPNGQTVLHTGDFRADPSMETYPELLSCRVQTLYLDTTYCSPEYTFPKQQDVINFAASSAFESVTLNPRTLVVCGSYSVGKEKVFLALAEVLGSKVCLSRDKFNTMCCLESAQIRERITTDGKAAQVHVLPMMQLTFSKLQDYLARFSQQYDRLVAFKPTGWTFSQQVESVEDIQPQSSGNVSIYGIPYSEHSSFLELKRFVQWLRPLKIIPTVNVGSWKSRKNMEKCFSDWLNEPKAKR